MVTKTLAGPRVVDGERLTSVAYTVLIYDSGPGSRLYISPYLRPHPYSG